MLKKAPDPLLGAFGMAAGTIAVCGVAIALVPQPDWGCAPWMAGSVAVHLLYFTALSMAYRGGDLAPLYALMRGTPPVLVASLGVLVTHEWLPLLGWIGLALLVAGLLLLAHGKPANRKTMIWVAVAALCTAVYTVLDGMGSRAAGHAPAYVFWHGLLQSLLFCVGVLTYQRREATAFLRLTWLRSVAAGGASIIAYALALWAMGRAPIALVAALRETSVLFAALLGAFWLREPLGWRRLAAAVLVATGAAVMHLKG